MAWIGDGAVEIADTEGHIVVSEKALAFGLAWAPDGREVWFTGSWNSGTEDRALYALSLAGKRRLIARAPGALTIMDVAPDGRGALVYTGAGWFSIVASRRGETQEQSLDLFGRTFIYGLSVDGTKLLAYEWSQVGPGMVLARHGRRRSRRLGDDTPLGLSPAGDWALVRRSSDPSRLLLVPTSAGSPRELPIPAGLTPLAGPDAHWSPDGRRLFVAFGASTSDRGSARLYMRRTTGPGSRSRPRESPGPLRCRQMALPSRPLTRPVSSRCFLLTVVHPDASTASAALLSSGVQTNVGCSCAAVGSCRRRRKCTGASSAAAGLNRGGISRRQICRGSPTLTASCSPTTAIFVCTAIRATSSNLYFVQGVR